MRDWTGLLSSVVDVVLFSLLSPKTTIATPAESATKHNHCLGLYEGPNFLCECKSWTHLLNHPVCSTRETRRTYSLIIMCESLRLALIR